MKINPGAKGLRFLSNAKHFLFCFAGHNTDSLFEDIHWLLLIATNVLTMDCIDDKASIPSDILIYEAQCQQRGEIDIDSSVQFITKLGRNCGTGKGTFCHT